MRSSLGIDMFDWMNEDEEEDDEMDWSLGGISSDEELSENED